VAEQFLAESEFAPPDSVNDRAALVERMISEYLLHAVWSEVAERLVLLAPGEIAP
jgi:hypothetical protein